eukprot:g39060.t1
MLVHLKGCLGHWIVSKEETLPTYIHDSSDAVHDIDNFQSPGPNYGGIEGLDIYGEQKVVRGMELEIVNLVEGIRGILDVGGQCLDKWREDGVKLGAMRSVEQEQAYTMGLLGQSSLWIYASIPHQDGLRALGNKLSIAIHYKATDSHNYLHYSSSHPTSCKGFIPFFQFFHLRYICLDNANFQNITADMACFFHDHGFHPAVVNSAINHIQSIT